MIENSQPGGGYLLHHDGLSIRFRIEFSDRKHLAITVHPEMRLEVDAPAGTDSAVILSRVQKQTKWIVTQWRYFESHQPKYPRFPVRRGRDHRFKHLWKVKKQGKHEVLFDGGFSTQIRKTKAHQKTTCFDRRAFSNKDLRRPKMFKAVGRDPPLPRQAVPAQGREGRGAFGETRRPLVSDSHRGPRRCRQDEGFARRVVPGARQGDLPDPARGVPKGVQHSGT